MDMSRHRLAALFFAIPSLSLYVHASTSPQDATYYRVYTPPTIQEEINMFIAANTPLSKIKACIDEHNIPSPMYFQIITNNGLKKYHFGLPQPLPTPDRSFEQFISQDLFFDTSNTTKEVYKGTTKPQGQGYAPQVFPKRSKRAIKNIMDIGFFFNHSTKCTNFVLTKDQDVIKIDNKEDMDKLLKDTQQDNTKDTPVVQKPNPLSSNTVVNARSDSKRTKSQNPIKIEQPKDIDKLPKDTQQDNTKDTPVVQDVDSPPSNKMVNYSMGMLCIVVCLGILYEYIHPSSPDQEDDKQEDKKKKGTKKPPQTKDL